MSAFMKITRNEIEQVTEHVPEQVVDLMGYEGKGVAITWRFFGESGDYLAISEVIAKLLGRNWVTNGPYFASIFNKKILPHFQRTWMTRIGQIFTDPCLSASSVQSVFYRNPSMIDDDKKPQMKAPRVAPLEGASTYAPAGAYVTMHCGDHDADKCRYINATYFIKKTHRKRHKERKVAQHEPFLSLRLNLFFAPSHERTPPVPAVHSRSSRAGG